MKLVAYRARALMLLTLVALKTLSAADSLIAQEQEATLEQARQLSAEIDGIVFYVMPDFTRLLDGTVASIQDHDISSRRISSSQAEQDTIIIFFDGEGPVRIDGDHIIGGISKDVIDVYHIIKERQRSKAYN